MSAIVLVPFVGAWPDEALEAAEKDLPEHGFVIRAAAIGPAEHAYFDELDAMWGLCGASGADLVAIEGDVVIHEGVLRGFDACPNLICAHVYWVGASYKYGLGCTRFRAELIRENLDLLRVAGQRTSDGLPIAYSWKRMDTRLYDEARERGLLPVYIGPGDSRPCIHEPAVRHLHRYALPEPGSPEDEQWAIARFRNEHA